MNRQEIFDKIQAIVAEYLSIEHENITFDFPLIEPNSNSSCRYWGFSISGDELVAIEIISKDSGGRVLTKGTLEEDYHRYERKPASRIRP
ncbi:MAG: hypothetical protein V7L19_05430, partial [Nostoc sp.]